MVEYVQAKQLKLKNAPFHVVLFSSSKTLRREIQELQKWLDFKGHSEKS